MCFGDVNCMLIIFCENRSRLCFVVMSCYCLVVSRMKVGKQRRRRAFFIFCCACARLVLCFNPREGSSNECHLVAATIPEDRLRDEERYPRWKSGFSLGHFYCKFSTYLVGTEENLVQYLLLIDILNYTQNVGITHICPLVPSIH